MIELTELKKNVPNYFDLTEKQIDAIREKIKQRVFGKTPFTFYVNNIVSLFENPYWFGSAICDLIYWIEDMEGKNFDLDIVGYYINEIGYCDYIEKSNEIMMLGLIELLTPPNSINKNKYIKGLIGRYINKE